MSARGTTNTNVRGSAESRRIRKQWLLDTTGDGVVTHCWRCSISLTFETLTVDRIIPGAKGGRYVRGNIRPSCLRCNSQDGCQLRETMKREKVNA